MDKFTNACNRVTVATRWLADLIFLAILAVTAYTAWFKPSVVGHPADFLDALHIVAGITAFVCYVMYRTRRRRRV